MLKTVITRFYRTGFAIVLVLTMAMVFPVSAEEEAVEEVQMGPIIVDGPGGMCSYDDLQDAINDAPDESYIVIMPGTYEAEPVEFVEKLCGNCLDPVTDVNASRGFYIKDKSLMIVGSGTDETILVTNAGYGVFIEGCPDVKLYNLAITGGERDQDGAATCAAVVVRNSSVEVAYCEIRDNQGDYEKPVAGIGGVFGREGAILNIHHNVIHDNSWDGVALYRGAVAQIYDNEIYNGRGAGVGITWDARADVIRNDIHDYWKGIGSFGETRVGAYHNFVHDLAGWGIVATGTSDMICRNNTVVRCGNVGIAGWSDEAKMEIVNNVIAHNGGREKWVAPRVGIWMNCIEGNYRIGFNLFHDNYDCDVAFGYIETGDDWTYEEERDYIGEDGNIKASPMFKDDGPETGLTSPCRDAGDPQYVDLDGTISDIGSDLKDALESADEDTD
jgi:hypothetical protein